MTPTRLGRYQTADTYNTGDAYQGLPARKPLASDVLENGTRPGPFGAEYRNSIDRFLADIADRDALAPLRNWEAVGAIYPSVPAAIVDVATGGWEVWADYAGNSGVIPVGDICTPISNQNADPTDATYQTIAAVCSYSESVPSMRVRMVRKVSDGSVHFLFWPASGLGTLGQVATHTGTVPSVSDVSYHPDSLQWWPQQNKFVAVIDSLIITSNADGSEWTTQGTCPVDTNVAGVCVALGVGPTDVLVTKYTDYGGYYGTDCRKWLGGSNWAPTCQVAVTYGAPALGRGAALGYAADLCLWIAVTEAGTVYTADNPVDGPWVARNVGFTPSFMGFAFSVSSVQCQPRIAGPTIVGLVDMLGTGGANFRYSLVSSDDLGATWTSRRTQASLFYWGGQRAYLLDATQNPYQIWRSRTLGSQRSAFIAS